MTADRPTCKGGACPWNRSEPVDLRELNAAYGRRWKISPAVGGGWYAVRPHDLSPVCLQRGLSNVRCGQTLEELAAHLAAEARIEAQWWTGDVLSQVLGPVNGDRPEQARRQG